MPPGKRLAPGYLRVPVKSPDLSPIENSWWTLKCKVAKTLLARTVVELEKQDQEEWEAIPEEAIQAMIDPMPYRFAELIAAHGGHTH